MIHVSPGSQVRQLIELLSVVGEYPVSSLHLLGNERWVKMLVHTLCAPQTFLRTETGETVTVRLLNQSGKGAFKSVRFYKAALPILDWFGARESYLQRFYSHKFPGDQGHRERNHRVAEAAAMCMRAGIEIRPYHLPELQSRAILSVIPEQPLLYPAKDLKNAGGGELNKTMYTRLTGALFSHGGCYAIYNTRAAAMKWNGMGEFKALQNLHELARLNAGIARTDSAILFGRSEQIGLESVLSTGRSRQTEFRFDSIYKHVFFIPMNDFGIRQLRLMTLPDWNEKLAELLFAPETRSYHAGQFEYDACVDGVYVLSFLDGDLARLIRFREGLQDDYRYEVLCYPHQAKILREYLPKIPIRVIELGLVEEGMGLGRLM